MNFKFNSVL